MSVPEPPIEELWKDIIHYEGRYEISNLGRVRSLLRGGLILRPGKYKGYLLVQLTGPEKDNKMFQIHRLVAQHFLDDWNQELTVDHINHDRSDNRYVNLRMISLSKNISNQCKDGLSSTYHGVYWVKAKKQWRARIGRNGARISIGTYSNELEAAKARDDYIRENGWEEDYEMNELIEV